MAQEKNYRKQKTKKDFDKRSKYQFYMDFKKNYPNAVISVGQML